MKLEYTTALRAVAERRVGSSPTTGTIYLEDKMNTKLKVFLYIRASTVDYNSDLIHFLIDKKIDFKLEETEKGNVFVNVHRATIYSELTPNDVAEKIVILNQLVNHSVAAYITITG